MTGGIGCFDKEGLPVRFERFGYLDVKGMFYSSKKVDLEMKKLYDQEVALKVISGQRMEYFREYCFCSSVVIVLSC